MDHWTQDLFAAKVRAFKALGEVGSYLDLFPLLSHLTSYLFSHISLTIIGDRILSSDVTVTHA